MRGAHVLTSTSARISARGPLQTTTLSAGPSDAQTGVCTVRRTNSWSSRRRVHMCPSPQSVVDVQRLTCADGAGSLRYGSGSRQRSSQSGSCVTKHARGSRWAADTASCLQQDIGCSTNEERATSVLSEKSERDGVWIRWIWKSYVSRSAGKTAGGERGGREYSRRDERKPRTQRRKVQPIPYYATACPTRWRAVLSENCKPGLLSM